MAPSQTFDIFVGTETGFLKGIMNISKVCNSHIVVLRLCDERYIWFLGVNTSHKYFKNLNSLDSLDKQREIITMIWNDSNETEVFIKWHWSI